MQNWLLTTEAQSVLADLSDAKPTPALISRLRRKFRVEQVSALNEQIELRQRGRIKFRFADRMLFTRVGLEQATDEAIARYKAKRFAGATQVMDICSGVGGDLSGFASQGISAIGIDRDPMLASFAAHNSRLYQFESPATQITTRCQEANLELVKECDAWHADPDRRIGGKRSTQPETHEPSLAELASWRETVSTAAIKFAPAARLPEDWQEECELEWISRAGECRQLVAWSGSLASCAGLRRATRLSNDLLEEVSQPDTFSGEPDLAIVVADQCKGFLYEPDSAILAAHLTGALANKCHLQALTPGVAYLTSDETIDDPLLNRFRLEEQLPFDRKKIAKWLSERSIGRLEIKCRAVDVDPAKFRKLLKLKGDQAVTLMIAPSKENRNKPQVFVCQRS